MEVRISVIHYISFLKAELDQIVQEDQLMQV